MEITGSKLGIRPGGIDSALLNGPPQESDPNGVESDVESLQVVLRQPESGGQVPLLEGSLVPLVSRYPVAIILGGAPKEVRCGPNPCSRCGLQPSDAFSAIFRTARMLQEDMTQRRHPFWTSRPRGLLEQCPLSPELAPSASRVAILDGQFQQAVGFSATR
jgi:hypothetical protein